MDTFELNKHNYDATELEEKKLSWEKTEIKRILSPLLHDDLVDSWFNTAVPACGFLTPIEILKQGRFEELKQILLQINPNG